MTGKTKIQIKREQAYRKQLKKCGFRSWKRANERRVKLIRESVKTDIESKELKELQRLADLYTKWKTNDEKGRMIRRLKRMLNEMQ